MAWVRRWIWQPRHDDRLALVEREVAAVKDRVNGLEKAMISFGRAVDD